MDERGEMLRSMAQSAKARADRAYADLHADGRVPSGVEMAELGRLREAELDAVGALHEYRASYAAR